MSKKVLTIQEVHHQNEIKMNKTQLLKKMTKFQLFSTN